MSAQILDRDSLLARQISTLARRGALPHAVILSGAGDRLAAGRYLAAAMVCRGEGRRPCLTCEPCRKVLGDIHPDVHIVREEGRRELSVDEIRRIRQDAYIYPNDGEQKVYLFADCTQLNERDQNVLLKIVEEGPAHAGFIFCAESAAALLPTIRSRCVELKLRGGEDGAAAEQAQELCRAFATGQLMPVVSLLVSLENRRPKREQVQQLLQDAWRTVSRALLLQYGAPEEPSEPAAELSRKLSRRQLQRLNDMLAHYGAECDYNVGAGHVLGAVCAEWEEIL
jgi:hypothetical protein